MFESKSSCYCSNVDVLFIGFGYWEMEEDLVEKGEIDNMRGWEGCRGEERRWRWEKIVDDVLNVGGKVLSCIFFEVFGSIFRFC